MNNDLISRKYMKEAIEQFFVREKYYHPYSKGRKTIPTEEVLDIIDTAPAANEMEKPFITECRATAIEKNLPLYFIYYEENGIFEVYVTETKELFEKRHCSKHLSNYEFKEIVTRYLDDYSDWKGGAE
jgi:hypothetical protein